MYTSEVAWDSHARFSLLLIGICKGYAWVCTQAEPVCAGELCLVLLQVLNISKRIAFTKGNEYTNQYTHNITEEMDFGNLCFFS